MTILSACLIVMIIGCNPNISSHSLMQLVQMNWLISLTSYVNFITCLNGTFLSLQTFRKNGPLEPSDWLLRKFKGKILFCFDIPLMQQFCIAFTFKKEANKLPWKFIIFWWFCSPQKGSELIKNIETVCKW